jgi:hypothetical protein
VQPTTAISILTVGVSVATVIANLYIARASRKTSLEVLRFKAALDRADASARLIKELETESERLRIRGHELITQIRKVHAHSETPLRYEGPVEEVIGSGMKFSEQASVFLEKWATVKGELSDEHLRLLAELRHECRASIDNIVVVLMMLQRKKEPTSIIQKLNDVESAIRILLALLQEFIVKISNVRKAISQKA